MSILEESKLSYLESLSQSQASFQTVQWFWQADLDPWKEVDPKKRKWEPYSENDCDIIEEAFSLKQNMVILQNYEIDLKKMLQINKKDRSRVRRVKREVDQDPKSSFMMEMPESLVIEKEKVQKTNNPAFGDVQQFLNFLMKRTQESNKLYHRLMELSLDCKQEEYGDVVRQVIECIQKGAEVREKVVKGRQNSRRKTFIQEAKEVVAEIEAHCIAPNSRLRDFFRVILRIYTKETFVCYWLNERLRSESWEDINVLTPYLVCLTYAFKIEDYVIKYQEPKGFMQNLINFFKPSKLVLYRGTALTSEYLEHYNPKKEKFFSWNCVTSTSRSEEEALKFLGRALRELKRRSPNNSFGVLFRIEVDFSSITNNNGMIDVSSYAEWKSEQEVIFAPGTVFEVLSKQAQNDNTFVIKLRVIKNFNQKHRLLGDLQEKTVIGEKVIFKSMASNDIIRSLQLLEGNQTVTKLEIEDCLIDSYLLDLIETIRCSTNIKKEDIVLTHNKIVIESLGILVHYFPALDLNTLCEDNSVIFKDEASNLQLNKECKGKKLCLSKKSLQMFLENEQIEKLFKKMKTESHISHLDLSVKNLPVSEEDLLSLMDSIGGLSDLKHLSLDFDYNLSISDNLLYKLTTNLSRVSALHSISISLANCSRMLGTKLDPCKDFEAERGCLVNLTHLSIDFMRSKWVSYNLIREFAKLLHSMPNLQWLCLNFAESEEHFDMLLLVLCDALILLTSLKSLSLNVLNWNHGTISKMNNLKYTLTQLTSLNYLSINFLSNKLSDFNARTMRWYWLSDSDPVEEDSTKWKWEPFSFDDCNKIEEALLLNIKKVYLGDYIVDLERMIRLHEKDPSLIKRIKRELERPTPLVIKKHPKTINPVFGNLEHFLYFISHRTSETYNIYQKLNKLSLDSKKNEFEDIVQKVIRCIRQEAKIRRKDLKEGSCFLFDELTIVRIETSIQRKSLSQDSTLQDFLDAVLGVYISETSVCYRLNELLRSENWEKLNVLAPYLVCFAYRFQLVNFLMDFALHPSREQVLYYRGITMAVEDIESYNPAKTKFFSWNGFTSTFKDKKVALKFLYFLKGPNRLDVLFIIEVDRQDSKGMIEWGYLFDEEVILPPGSVFTIISIELKFDLGFSFYEIKLKVVKMFCENHQLLGALHNIIVSGTKATLDNLSFHTFLDALKLLEGNQLITSLEIKHCSLNSDLLERIENMRKTTNIEKDNIILIENQLIISNLPRFCEDFPLGNFSPQCRDNKIVFEYSTQQIDLRNRKLKRLRLDKEILHLIFSQSLLSEVEKRIKEDDQILDLNLIIQDLPISEDEIFSLLGFVNKLTDLQTLWLDFETCKGLSDAILSQLKNVLSELDSLHGLSLNFAECSNLKYNGINSLKTGLEECRSLRYLFLNFKSCNNIASTLLSAKTDWLSSLTNLKDLSLNFSYCDELGDEEVTKLSDTILLMGSLPRLCLDFESCTKITDVGLKNLSNALKCHPSLSVVSLNFNECVGIPDKNKNELRNELLSLPALPSLNI